MTKFLVLKDSYVETNSAETGTIGFNFVAGSIESDNPVQVAALTQLVHSGGASVEDTTDSSTSTGASSPDNTASED